MSKEKRIVTFDHGNATVIFDEDDLMNIIITSNGVKYEFEATPSGIMSYRIDGGKKKIYARIMER